MRGQDFKYRGSLSLFKQRQGFFYSLNESVEKVDSETAAYLALVLTFLLTDFHVVGYQSSALYFVAFLGITTGLILPPMCIPTHHIGVFSADYAPYNTTSTGYLPSFSYAS